MLRSLCRPWKQDTYIKLNGTALTHALKSNTQFSLMFITLHDGMSHGSCKCPLLWHCLCLLLVHLLVENLSLFMCWQYKWQHGSSSTGGGVRGLFGLSNGVRRLSDDWQEELKVVKLFSLWDEREEERMDLNFCKCEVQNHEFPRTMPTWRWPEITNGATTHQVDVKNGSVVTVYVHIHGALLWSEADSTVLQGKRRTGCDVISNTEKDVFILTEVADNPESLQCGSKAAV